MASRKMDLNQRTFLVLSGLSNPLGKTLAVKLCRRYKSGSVAMLIDTSEELLQEIKKEIQELENHIEVICCVIDSWQQVDAVLFHQLFDTALDAYPVVAKEFDLAMIVHNEGTGATQKLMEPQSVDNWKSYIQENLYAVVALNQEFLKMSQLDGIEKIIINISSSIMIQPLTYSSLKCSCKKARDMYFRAMANEERAVSVLNYGAGIFECHVPERDINNNVVDLKHLEIPEKITKLPFVTPQQSSLKLINILEELSFISGHDVDYYDTYVL